MSYDGSFSSNQVSRWSLSSLGSGEANRIYWLTFNIFQICLKTGASHPAKYQGGLEVLWGVEGWASQSYLLTRPPSLLGALFWNALCHVWMRHVMYEWVMSHSVWCVLTRPSLPFGALFLNESCHTVTYEWVTSHVVSSLWLFFFPTSRPVVE